MKTFLYNFLWAMLYVIATLASTLGLLYLIIAGLFGDLWHLTFWASIAVLGSIGLWVLVLAHFTDDFQPYNT